MNNDWSFIQIDEISSFNLKDLKFLNRIKWTVPTPKALQNVSKSFNNTFFIRLIKNFKCMMLSFFVF